MRYPGFIGGSGRSLSPLAGLEQTMNYYPEMATNGQLFFCPVPGFSTLVTSPGLGMRAAFSENGRTFVVMGNAFQELLANHTLVDRGPVGNDGQLAQIVGNGVSGGQLLIAAGGNAYCFVLATNAFTQVLTGEAFQIGMLDTYFLAFNQTTGAVRFSAPNDGTSWAALDIFTNSITPDKWRAMCVNQGKIWLIGEYNGQVWWDAGGADIPFEPIQSSVFSYGIVAPSSLIAVGDSVRWLSSTRDGDGVVVGARGYRPERISDHPTELAIANYKLTSNITDCEALTYQETGHTFSAFRFPSANATRVLDDATNIWHERGRWAANENQFVEWSPRVHVAAMGLHIIGDQDTGKISVMDQRFYTDVDGSVIRRVRVPPALFSNGRRVTLDRLELRMQPGLAPQSPVTGYNPLVSLSLSGDMGQTWSNERFVSAGLVGQYGRKLVWTQNGSSENGMVPRFVCTDPVQWNLVDLLVEGTGFGQPSA